MICASFLKNEMDNPLAEGKGGDVFRSILDIQLAYDANHSG